MSECKPGSMRVYQRRGVDAKPLDCFDPAQFEAIADVEGDDLDSAWRATCSKTPGGWQKAAIDNPRITMLREIPATAVCFTKEGDVVERKGEYHMLTYGYHSNIIWKPVSKLLAADAAVIAEPSPTEKAADAKLVASRLPAPASVAVGETMRLF